MASNNKKIKATNTAPIDENVELLTSEISNEYLLNYFYILPNANKILNEAGVKYEVLIDMLDDPQILAVANKRKEIAKSYDWKITGDNEEVVNFVTNVFNKNIDIPKIIDGLFTGMQIGYAVLEIIWEFDENGKIIIGEIKKRNPLRFSFKPDGTLLYRDKFGALQTAPEYKFMIFTYNSLDDSNPYGKPLNASCFWYWQFKKKGWTYWLTALQKYGLAPLIYKAIADEDDENLENEINNKTSILKAVQSGSSAVIDKEEEIIALETKPDKDSFNSFIEIADKQITKIYLGNPQLMDDTKFGSKASNEVNLDILKLLVEADLKSYANTIQDYLIKPLVLLNFGNDVEMPIFSFYDSDEEQKIDDQNTEENQNTIQNNEEENQKHTKGTFEDVEEFANANDIPEHTQALEGQITSVYNANKTRLKTIFNFKNLNDDPKVAVNQLNDFYFDIKQKLGENISYSLFYAMLLGKYEATKTNYSLFTKIVNKFKSDAKLYTNVLLPFDEARKLFKNKVVLTDEEFENLTNEAKATAFRIAGINSRKITSAVYNMLQNNFNKKGEWKKQASEYLSQYGFDLKGNHLDTIYRTNIFQTYSVAQWNKYKEVEKQFPALRYTAVMDARTRPTHAALNGKVFMLNDPIWGRIYPPNGYNCRCTTIPVSKTKLKSVKVEDGNSNEWKNFKVDDGFNFNPAEAVREYQPVAYAGDMENNITYKDYNLSDVIEPSKLPSSVDLSKKDKFKKRIEYADYLGNNILFNNGTEVNRNLSVDILQNPSEIWVYQMENTNGKPTYKIRYIKKYLDNNNKENNFVLEIDKYNQFINLKKVNSLGLYRKGVLLYSKINND